MSKKSETKEGKHGGTRLGAGRKTGTGAYGEKTQPVRIPVSVLPAVRALLTRLGEKPTGADILRLPAQLSQISLPLYGSRVPAGFPSPADEHLEATLDLNAHLIPHPAATFIVRVQGLSMIGAGINDGDLLIVDRALEAASGDIVVAVLNGELTVKRLHIESGKVWLMPENPDFKPLEITEETSLHIWGVASSSVHALKR
jgi:DNA polymerase V